MKQYFNNIKQNEIRYLKKAINLPLKLLKEYLQKAYKI